MNALRAGAARVVITPPIGTPLAGYFEPRPSTGVLDDLHAHALVLGNGQQAVALVSCDLLSIKRSTVLTMRRQITTRTGIPPGNILISRTHAHTGPYTSATFGGVMNESYLEGLTDLVAGAVDKAWSARQSAQISFSTGTVEGIAFNRRFRMRDGQVRTNPGIGNPDIAGPVGPVDTMLGVISVTGPDGKPAGAWINYAVHADVVSGDNISADYPGALGAAMRREFGDEFVSVYANGACGNTNHIDTSGPSKQGGSEHARRMGEAIAGEAARVIRAGAPGALRGIQTSSTELRIPLREISAEQIAWAEEILRQAGADTGGALTSEDLGAPSADAVYARETLEVVRQRADEPEAIVEVQVIVLGDTAIVAFPAEVFAEIGLEVKAKSPFTHTFVACYANGIVGYIPTQAAFSEGGYEVRTARSSKLVPEAAGMITSAALELLERMRRPS